jgi:2',3'-cyclic-nucleotide 2'-phosphodiesterase
LLILSIGDVIGKPGREAISQLLPGLRREYKVDFVILNGENAAGGVGLTQATARELLDAGVDVLTSGNHIWAQKDIIPSLDSDMPVIRPLNYPPGVPGRGYIVRGGVAVVNLIGRTYIGSYDCPFRTMDALLAKLGQKTVIVDFHAEATSEKVALGWYLDGRVSAVLGTHTHVGTTDTRILPHGTAYVTDIGMTGPLESVIGDNVEAVIQRFLTNLPNRLGVGQGRVGFNGILVRVDDATGRATSIERIYREVEGSEPDRPPYSLHSL